MGEFFILAKFQNKGIGYKVAKEIFRKFPGRWSVAVMPENIKAVNFWRKIINQISGGNFNEIFKNSDELTSPDNPDPSSMNILSFDTITHNKNVTEVFTSQATEDDIGAMVSLSSQKRASYEQAQPQFWHKAKNADVIQTDWFKELICNKNYILLCARHHEQIIGFIIGQLINAPKVYDPGGLTLMIDDFCVKSTYRWQDVGTLLLDELKKNVVDKGVAQVLIVCGKHDELKRQFLSDQDLSVASEWYVGINTL